MSFIIGLFVAFLFILVYVIFMAFTCVLMSYPQDVQNIDESMIKVSILWPILLPLGFIVFVWQKSTELFYNLISKSKNKKSDKACL